MDGARVVLTSFLSLSALWGPPAPAQPPQAKAPDAATLPAPASEPAATPLFTPDEVFPAGTEVLPIDLPTVLRLTEANNPTIALARLRVEEAYAHLTQAQLLWLPNLDANPIYLRHDGEIQNSAGIVFQTNKSALAGLGAASLRVQSSDALFAPLIARRLAEAQSAASQAVNNNIQLNAVLAYFDLLQGYGLLAVNAEILARARHVLHQTEEATKAQLAKTGADINRARTEVELRVQERIALKGQVRVASSRLARLLLLQPSVALVPGEPCVVPLVLVPEGGPVDELIQVGVMSRPEVAEGRALVAAGQARLRQSQLSPLLPYVELTYSGGTFGGGQDSFVGHFNPRGDGTAQAVWELRNLGLGNLAENRVRRAQLGQADLHVVEVQAQVADEVNEAAQIARARREALGSAQEAVTQALEMYRKLYLLSISMTGPKKEVDTLEPLLALDTLSRARVLYLGAVLDYNRAQYQLFTAMGRPPLAALPKPNPEAIQVPPVPPPYQPQQPK
jgi:outer membrane protein TolC